MLKFNTSHAEHRDHLRTVFQHLADRRNNIHVQKSVLGPESSTFLGSLVTASGVQPMPYSIAAFRDFQGHLMQRGSDVPWERLTSIDRYFRTQTASKRRFMAPCQSSAAAGYYVDSENYHIHGPQYALQGFQII